MLPIEYRVAIAYPDPLRVAKRQQPYKNREDWFAARQNTAFLAVFADRANYRLENQRVRESAGSSGKCRKRKARLSAGCFAA